MTTKKKIALSFSIFALFLLIYGFLNCSETYATTADINDTTITVFSTEKDFNTVNLIAGKTYTVTIKGDNQDALSSSAEDGDTAYSPVSINNVDVNPTTGECKVKLEYPIPTVLECDMIGWVYVKDNPDYPDQEGWIEDSYESFRYKVPYIWGTLYFNSNGGNEATSSIYQKNNAICTKFPKFTKSGYELEYWSYSQKDTSKSDRVYSYTPISFLDYYGVYPVESKTLYAQWKLVRVDELYLNYRSKALNIGNRFALKATIYPTNSQATVSWRSSNSNIATVSQSGTVTAQRLGIASIYVKAGSIVKTCKVSIQNKYREYWKGYSYTLIPYIKHLSGYTSATWHSNNSSVISVSSKGILKTRKTGSATIRCTIKGVNYYFSVYSYTYSNIKSRVLSYCKSYNGVKYKSSFKLTGSLNDLGFTFYGTKSGERVKCTGKYHHRATTVSSIKRY